MILAVCFIYKRYTILYVQGQCLGAWLSGGFDGLRFVAGLDDLKGLFQSKTFWFSKISLAEI